MSVERIEERVERGEDRRDLRLPVSATYSLARLLPRRPEGRGYRLPGDMGAPLARAFEQTFALLERGTGPLAVQAPSKMLTPYWHRVVEALRRHGLARSILLSLPLKNGIPLYYFDLAAPFQAHLTDGVRPELSRYARGFSEDYDHALAKVVGECLERTPLLYFRMQDLLRGSPRSLRDAGMPFLEPSTVSIFSEAQRAARPETRFDDDSVYHWTKLRSLVTPSGRSAEAWAPTQLVHWNYPTHWGDVPEPMLRESSSHGAGGYYSLEGALLSGALECVQRDGFFLHWLRGVVPARIDPATITRPATLALIQHAKEVGLETVFLDVTSELGIPTCICILLRTDGGMPYSSMGGSCRLDGATAVHDALLEAASVHHVIAKDETRVRIGKDYQPHRDATFTAHKRLAFWANPEHAPHLAFFLEGRTISLTEFARGVPVTNDPERDLAHVVDVLRRHRLDAWFYEAEHPALDELGYASVRVIIPELVPLYYHERNAPLGLRRLAEAPFLSEDARQRPLTPWPHPFP